MSRKNSRSLLLKVVAVASVTSLTLAACGGSGGSSSSSSPIRIGALFPTSGTLAALGTVSAEGAALAVQLTNDDGGVNGRKVVLVSGDASTAATAVSEATRLTTKEGLKVILGTYASDLSLAASAAAARSGALYWEANAISDELTSRGLNNFFQFPYRASTNGSTAADLIKDIVDPVLGRPAKVVIVHNDSSYGALVASGAEKQAKANGLTVLGNLSYPTSTNDQNALALRIGQAKPDAVIAASYQNDAVLLQNSMRQQNVNVAAFVGTGGIYGLPAFGTALGKSVNGIFDTEGSADVPADTLSPAAQELRKRFVSSWKKAHKNEEPTFLPTIAFDATWVLIHDVLAKASSEDPAALSKAARAIDLPVGSTILGYGVKFNDKGLNTRSFVIGSQWQNGKLVVVYPKKYASAPSTLLPLPAWSNR